MSARSQAGQSIVLFWPEGDWIDYWTGGRLTGPVDTAVDVPLDRLPLFVRAGAIIPRIPEDVMTLAPSNPADSVQGLDDRRVYEMYPGPARGIVDFEGRRLVVTRKGRGAALRITGKAARVTVVWRFARPAGVTLNGVPLSVTPVGEGASVTFEHSALQVIRW